MTRQLLAFSARLAVRKAFRQRGHTIGTTVILALAIGVNTAAFGALKAVLLNQLPFRESAQVVVLNQRATSGSELGLSPLEIREWRALAASLDGAAEFHSMAFNAEVEGNPFRLQAGVVSASFFDVLGIQAKTGRLFHDADEHAGAAPVAVLALPFWRKALDADPGAVGKVLTMNGVPHVIVGILPELPPFPAAYDVVIPTSASPYRSRPAWERRTARVVTALGRLSAGTTESVAQAELTMVARRLQDQFPSDYPKDQVVATVTPVSSVMTSEARPSLMALQALAFLVLVAAIANLACLTLANVRRHSGELLTRISLGARLRHTLTQLALEHLVVAIAGGAVSLPVAWICIRIVSSWLAPVTPRAIEIRMDASVVVCAACVSVLCAMVLTGFALLAQLRAMRGYVSLSRGRGPIAHHRSGALKGLVGIQIAVSLALLYSAALTAQSVANLLREEPGYDGTNVVAVELSLDWAKYAHPGAGVPRLRHAEVKMYYDEAMRRVAACAGVRDVGLVTELPVKADGLLRRVASSGGAGPAQTAQAAFLTASPGYFRTLGVPLLAGRLFDLSDTGEQPTVALVSSSFAKGRFGGLDPVGKQISLDGGRSWLAVVGVVGDVQYGRLGVEIVPQVYVASGQNAQLGACLVVRTGTAPSALIGPILAAARSADPSQPVSFGGFLADRPIESIASHRLMLILLGLFAFLGIAVSITGVFGVVALEVSGRFSEFGLRMAVGASPNAIRLLPLRGLAKPVAFGVAVGCVLALGAGRLLASWLYGLVPRDLPSFAFSGAALGAAVAATGVLASWRAGNARPAELLRE